MHRTDETEPEDGAAGVTEAATDGVTEAETDGVTEAATVTVPEVVAVRRLTGDAAAVWALVTDARRHAAWIPLTRIDASGPPALGTEVVAVSGPFARRGAPGLVDRMRITRFDPPAGGRPGVAVFTKTGRVLRGDARIVVLPDDEPGTRVRWSEAVYLAGPLPRRWTAAVLAAPLRVMLRLALARAARS